MSIFEKIRELKFPFIAVVAALTFSGITAPANAAVPAVSSFTTNSLTTSSAQITFNMTVATSSGIGCKAIARLTSASAPTAADVLAATGYNTANGDLTSFTSNISNPGAVTSGTLSMSGLTGSTSYTMYVACQDGGSQSQLYSFAFTTSAPNTLVTPTSFSGTVSPGQTLTATSGVFGDTNQSVNKYWLICTVASQAAVGSAVSAITQNCWPMYENPTTRNLPPTQTPSTFTIPSNGVVETPYMNPTTTNLTNYFVAYYENSNGAKTITATVAYGASAGQQQQQQVTATVRKPAPEFKINTRPAVSANGQTLTLSGENLSDITSVKVGGKEAKISKKASGEIVIEVPAGTEGYPDVEVLHAGGTITMQGLIQVIKPYALTRTLKITKFVGERPTLAGLAALESAYLAGTTANILTCVATVASDASAEEITLTETRAKATCQRVVNYSKYIRTADVHISKDGAAGSKSVLAVTFDRTLTGK